MLDTGQHLLVIQNTVPGLPSEQTSYRSELAGIYTFLHLLLHLEQHFGINRGGITFACNNKSALETSFDYRTSTSNQKDFDFVSGIHSLLTKVQSTVDWQHVKSHQDDVLRIQDLSPMAKRNVKADQFAKAYASECNFEGHHQGKIVGELGRLISPNGSKVTSYAARTVHDMIQMKKLEDHWAHRQRLPTGKWSDVDTSSLSKAMKESTGGRRKFIVKYSARWMGTRSNLHRWGYRINATCQLCKNFDERIEHVIQCKYPQMTIQWLKAMMELHKWLLDQDTDPGVAHGIIQSLKAWRDGTPLPDTTYLGSWQDAFQNQTIIGWHGFFEGFLAPQWSQLQHMHYQDIKSRKTGARWTTKLIKKLWNILWDIWEFRNETVMTSEIVLHSPENEAINRQIDQEYDKGLDQIPARWCNLFQQPAQVTKGKSILYRKEWIATVEKLRIQYGGQHPISAQREFLSHWINRYEGR